MSGLKESIVNILDLIDETKRAYCDPLAEDGINFYSIKEIEDEQTKVPLTPMMCRSCPLWANRRDDYFYFNPKKADLLCLVEAVEESGQLLKKDAEAMYDKQMEGVLGLSRSRRALLPLLKCPSSSLNTKYADSCKIFLRDEMKSLSPRFMILFGFNLAHYMLRTNAPYDEIRAAKRHFKVNGIMTFVTYSQRECINNPSLKRDVLNDLNEIKRHLV